MENINAKVILKKTREKSLLNKHPWIFSGAVEYIKGEIEPGDIVSVYSFGGEFLAKGFINPESQIIIRVLTFENETVDYNFFLNRISKAINYRNAVIKNTTAYRLIHSDGDNLSGLVVDKYSNSVVIQIYSKGMNRIKSEITEILKELLNPDLILNKSESKILREEGLVSTKEILYGERQEFVEIVENGAKFNIDVFSGQKTGFFIDQRENRKRIGEFSGKDKNVLNCFSYTGGFSVYAALKGARTTSVDISLNAVEMSKKNFQLNNIDLSNHNFVTANVFEYLRNIDEEFDIMVLDPPGFVKSKKDFRNGTKAYKDINRVGIMKIKDEGLILTCSCSQFIDWDLFQKIIFSASQEAGRNVQIIGKFGQPEDHPINIYQPEGEYLKSFLLRVYK